MKALISVSPLKASPIERAARAAFTALTGGRDRDATDACQRLYPDDYIALSILTKAAVQPAKTGTSGNAAELVQAAFGEFLGSLAPVSAAATIVALGITMPPTGYGMSAPARGTALTALPWVGEGAPIPVRSYDLNGVNLQPRKFGIISVMSRSLSARSNADEVFRQLLREDAAFSLDAGYFSTAVGDDVTHPGLLDGATEITPSTAGGKAAFEADIEALLTVIMPGGSGRVVYVTGPVTAELLRIRFPDFVRDATLLPSPSVPENRFIALDAGSLVHSFGAEPDIDAAHQATLHMSTTPEQISTPGSPATIADPVRSLYQTDSIAVRLICDMAFGARRANVVAYVDDFDWAEVI